MRPLHNKAVKTLIVQWSHHRMNLPIVCDEYTLFHSCLEQSLLDIK